MTLEPAAAGEHRATRIASGLCRLLLGAVFLFAGAAKLLGPPEAFADNIASFRLVPTWLVSPLALALPPFEILVAMSLLAGRPRRLGAYGVLVLAVMFLAALLAALLRGIPADCGCFGTGASWLPLTAAQRTWFDLGRDLVLVVGALGLYRHQFSASRPETTR